MAGRNRSDKGSKHPVCGRCGHSKYYHQDIGSGRAVCKPCKTGKKGIQGVCSFDNIYRKPKQEVTGNSSPE